MKNSFTTKEGRIHVYFTDTDNLYVSHCPIG